MAESIILLNLKEDKPINVHSTFKTNVSQLQNGSNMNIRIVLD